MFVRVYVLKEGPYLQLLLLAVPVKFISLTTITITSQLPMYLYPLKCTTRTTNLNTKD
jgi:hypothetical protein